MNPLFQALLAALAARDQNKQQRVRKLRGEHAHAREKDRRARQMLAGTLRADSRGTDFDHVSDKHPVLRAAEIRVIQRSLGYGKASELRFPHDDMGAAL